MPMLGFLLILQFGFDFGGVIGDVGALINGLLDQLLAGIVEVFNQIIRALEFVWNGLFQVFEFLFGGFKALIAHLRAIAEWIHNRLIGRLIQWIETIKAKLHQIFDPILTVLKKIKAIQDYYFNTILKPVFDFIQRIRRVLLIFRLLHFKWAQKLDSYLAQQEAKIARAFLDVRQKMNELINWINLIVDPFGNIYSNVFLNTALTSINALWALLWGAQKGTLTSQEKAAQAHDAAIGTRAATLSSVRLRSATGLTPDDTALEEEAARDFAALGFTR